jgi:hypothetical protein
MPIPKPSWPGFVPAIHVLPAAWDNKDVDARHKAGHDGGLQELVIPDEPRRGMGKSPQ